MRFLNTLTLVVFMALSMTNCSSSEEQGQQGEGYENQGEDEYAEEGEGSEEGGQNEYGEEGNDYGNNGEYNQGGNNYEGGNGDDGEYVNNAGGEEYGEDFAGGEGGEALNNAPVEDEAFQMANDILGADATAGQSANELPQDGLGAAAPPSGNGIVKYAPGPVSVYDQPSGAVIGQLEQGDHPLVYDEGEFSRLSDGRYVGANDLSAQGVGRPRNPGMWQ